MPRNVVRNKKTVKKHRVDAHIQVFDLTKAGTSIEFEVYTDEGRIGRIIIGRGSLTWYGKRRRRGKTFSWSEFAEMMDKRVYGE